MKAFAQIKQKKEEDLEYISQFMKRNKKMKYVTYLGFCGLKGIVCKINYFLNMPNFTKNDILVIRDNEDRDGFQIAINVEKDSYE